MRENDISSTHALINRFCWRDRYNDKSVLYERIAYHFLQLCTGLNQGFEQELYYAKDVVAGTLSCSRGIALTEDAMIRFARNVVRRKGINYT